MMRIALTIVAAMALTACSGTVGVSPSLSSGGSDQTKLMDYASTAVYPENATASNDLAASAIIQRNGNRLQLLNGSDQPLRDVRVWVDGMYVLHVDTLPAHGSVMLSRGDFFNSAGQALDHPFTNADRIEIQTDSNNQLWRVKGPVQGQEN